MRPSGDFGCLRHADGGLRSIRCHFADTACGYYEIPAAANHEADVQGENTNGYFCACTYHRGIPVHYRNSWPCFRGRLQVGSRRFPNACRRSKRNCSLSRPGVENFIFPCAIGPGRHVAEACAQRTREFGLASTIFRGTQHVAAELFETLLVLFFLLISGDLFSAAPR